MDVRYRKGVLLSIVLMTVSVSPAYTQQPGGPSGSGSGASPQIHYYNGNRRIDLELALDELVVKRGNAARLPLQRLANLAPGGVVQELPGGDVLITYAAPAVDRARLNERAQAVRVLGHVALAAAYIAEGPRTEAFRMAIPNQFSLKLKDGVELDQVLADYDLHVVETVDFSPNTYIVETQSGALLDGLDTANAIYEARLAEFATPLVEQKRELRAVPNDPFYPNQWHLKNTGFQVGGAVAGNDVNIEGAWDQYTGTGVNIGIVDEGVDLNHEDLAAHMRTDIDIDVADGDSDPNSTSEIHATAVSGVAAGIGNNAKGITGAAFDANLVAIRLLGGGFGNDSKESTALDYLASAVNPANYLHVSNNSWGPSDCGCILGDFAGPLTEAALADGATNGRGGLGTIYVWAAGNGRPGDNVNFDAYASSRYTIAVGATGADGTFSYYSEPGSSMLVNTPSSFSSGGITTTDVTGGPGYSSTNYTSGFGGTSSASPLAAGIVALMLQANPNLGWRDVQHILVDTSTRNDPGQTNWHTNGSGRWFNFNYGYGRIDATAAVNRAKTWVPVPAGATPLTASASPSLFIPDNNPTGVQSTITLSNVPPGFFVEHVEVDFNATHSYRGDLYINLISPSGTADFPLATVHGDSGDNYNNWTFTSVAYWGEEPQGNWQLIVKDLQTHQPADGGGVFNSWALRVYGFLIDFNNVYVDQTYTSYEHGTPNRPYNTLLEGVNAVASGGTLHVAPGTYGEMASFSKPMRIAADGGTVRLNGM